MRFGVTELIIILAIVLVLFGGRGRIANIGSELGSAIRNFRQGIQDAQKKKTDEPES